MWGYFLTNLTQQTYDPWGQLKLINAAVVTHISYSLKTSSTNTIQGEYDINETKYSPLTGIYSFSAQLIGLNNTAFTASQLTIKQLTISNMNSGSATQPLVLKFVKIE